MEQPFSTAERKKAFEALFKARIIPFFKAHGYSRHTPSSKRFLKHFAKGLSLVIIFDYKPFGSGFYDLNFVYFDEEIGEVMDDYYLAAAKIKSPSIETGYASELESSMEKWLIKMENEVMPWLARHSDHGSILADIEQFNIFANRRQEYLDLMERKSKG